MDSTYLTYRTTAAAGADGLGLLIALYDTLAADLRRAAEAQRAMDIARRCKEANHALLVIGHLENWLSHGTAGELNTRMAAFYAKLRHDILDAQAEQSASLLEQQMKDVLMLRECWQRSGNSANSGHEGLEGNSVAPPSVYAEQPFRTGQNWSA